MQKSDHENKRLASHDQLSTRRIDVALDAKCKCKVVSKHFDGDIEFCT